MLHRIKIVKIKNNIVNIIETLLGVLKGQRGRCGAKEKEMRQKNLAREGRKERERGKRDR